MRLSWDVCDKPPAWLVVLVAQASTSNHHRCIAMVVLKCQEGELGALVQVDPHLSRTVVVSTKLDTRLPQFARGHDVELFLRPSGRLLEPGMLGGCPFFT